MDADTAQAATQLTGFDLAVITVVVLSTLIGVLRGFVREILSLAGWVGSAVITFYLYKPVASILAPHIAGEKLAMGTAVVGTFIVCLISFSILNLIIVRLVRAANLGSIDRSLGFAFGGARGVFLVALAYMMFSMIVPAESHPDMVTKAASKNLVATAATMLSGAVPSLAGEMQQLGGTLKADVTGIKSAEEGAAETSPEEKQKQERQNFLAAIMIRPDFAALNNAERKQLRSIMENVPPIAFGDSASASAMASSDAANMLINVVRLYKQLEYKKLAEGKEGAAPATIPHEQELTKLEEKLVYIFSKTSQIPASSTPTIAEPPPVAGVETQNDATPQQ